jgi:catechol 2,3-dioxygenase-like lactoylglutathione lyase family enzyme
MTTDSDVKLKIVEMDHIVIRIKDVEGALDFYTGILGLEPSRVEEWRRGDLPFPCARINANTLIDLKPWTEDEPVGDGRRNMDHFCLVLEPTDMNALSDHLRNQGVTVVSDAPAQRSGARGMATSIYIQDPEGNQIELRHY